MVGKQLSALLQILRTNGVMRYQTPDLTLELGPAPPPRALSRHSNPSPADVAREAMLDDEEDEEDEAGDPRFLLERLGPKHFPSAKADPRRNKAPQ